LLCQGVEVGTVRFRRITPGARGDSSTIGGNATLPTQNQIRILLSADRCSEDGGLGNSLTYSATFVGRDVVYRDAMMAIIGGLTLTAVNDKDEWVDSRIFSGFFSPYGCKFVLVTPVIAPLPYYHVQVRLVTAMLQASATFYLFCSGTAELRIVVSEGHPIIARLALVLRDVRDVR